MGIIAAGLNAGQAPGLAALVRRRTTKPRRVEVVPEKRGVVGKASTQEPNPGGGK